MPPLISSTFGFSTRVSSFSVPLSLRLRLLEFASSPGEFTSLNGRHACFNFLVDLSSELLLDMTTDTQHWNKRQTREVFFINVTTNKTWKTLLLERHLIKWFTLNEYVFRRVNSKQVNSECPVMICEVITLWILLFCVHNFRENITLSGSSQFCNLTMPCIANGKGAKWSCYLGTRNTLSFFHPWL